ncbi:MAG: amidohydrolase family protein [Planctomycetota bacterium]
MISTSLLPPLRVTRIVVGCVLATLACAVSLSAQSPSQKPQQFAVRAKRIVTGAGPDIIDGVILIEKGKIKALGQKLEVPKGWKVIDHRDRVLIPGMIDMASRAGAPKDLRESAVAVDSRTCALDAVALDHRDFAMLCEAGITAVGVLPERRNAYSGQGCVLKTGSAYQKRVVEVHGPVMMTLDASAYSRLRMPASYIGLIKLHRLILETAKGGRAGPSLVGLARGKRKGVLYARTEQALKDSLKLKRRFDLDITLMAANAIRRVVDEFANSGMRVALLTPTFRSGKRRLTLPALLEKKGIQVVFYADTPNLAPAGLRLGAALAAQNGLGRRAALASITSGPAEALGVAARIGSLAVGKDADFVVLSADPFDFSAAVIETWVDGRREYRKKPNAKKKELAP